MWGRVFSSYGGFIRKDVSLTNMLCPFSYEYPTVSNNIKVTPATYAELAKHPNIVRAKLAHQDLSWHAQICSNPSIDYTHFHPYTRLGQQVLPAVAVGATGAVDVVSAFFPKSVVHLYSLISKEQPTVDEIKAAKLLPYKVSAVGEFANKWSILGIKEAISRLRNFGDRDGVRLPSLGTTSFPSRSGRVGGTLLI